MRSALLILLAAGVVGWTGCQASPPGKLETATITYAEHHFLIGHKNRKSPLPDTPRTWSDGQEAFSYYCVACHGMDGQNTGVPFATRMSPPVPSLASAGVQSFTDGQLKWIIDYGIRPSGMPASQGTLSDDEQWAIVNFLRHLPPAGSQGAPALYTPKATPAP